MAESGADELDAGRLAREKQERQDALVKAHQVLMNP